MYCVSAPGYSMLYARHASYVCANMQVVVPQGVLVRASAELTVTQALEIADMTLETSCRAIQWAINVPEVLLASAGERPQLQLCVLTHQTCILELPVTAWHSSYPHLLVARLGGLH